MNEVSLGRVQHILTNATKRPWQQAHHVGEPRAIVAASNPDRSLLALDPDGMAIFDSVHDARLTVEAVNSLDTLLEIVKLALYYREEVRVARERGVYDDTSVKEMEETLFEVLNKVRP